MSKHTPGPWRKRTFERPSMHDPKGCERFAFTVESVAARLDDEHQICAIEPYVSASGKLGRDMHEANAALIAAAPELLEALKLFLSLTGAQQDMVIGSLRTQQPAQLRLRLAFDKARVAIAKAEGK